MADMKQFSGDKILCHHEILEEFFKSGVAVPINVELDMTNLCSNKCHYCYGYLVREHSKASLEKKDAVNIIGQLKEIGTKAILFTGGGDPLSNKYTIDVMEYAKKIGLEVSLITNGLNLLPEISERALKICTWIRVSVDADSPETYLKSHGMPASAWDKLINNIESLAQLKRKSGSNCTIGVGYLTSNENDKLENMMNFVRLFKKIGVDYSQFRPLMPRWKENKDVKEDTSLPDIIKCTKEATEKYDVLYSKPKYDLMKLPKELWRPYEKCLGVNFTTVISADMNVYVCCHHRGIEKYALGDLKKESFKDIWKKRQGVFDKINFKDCPYFCRNNPFNMILWDIKKGKRKIEKISERKHKNFL